MGLSCPCSGCGLWIRDMGSWVCALVVIWVFVSCAPVGFCWLWWLDFWTVLDGVTVGLAMGRGFWVVGRRSSHGS